MSKFKIGDFLMHKNGMDACVEVVYQQSKFSFVRWGCLGYTGKPWLLDETEYLISDEALNSSNWIVLDPVTLTTPRLFSGAPKLPC